MEAVFRWLNISGSARNQQEPVETGSWIRSPDFWYFSAGSGWKRWVSWGFSLEIHWIRLPESSCWVFINFHYQEWILKMYWMMEYKYYYFYWKKILYWFVRYVIFKYASLVISDRQTFFREKYLFAQIVSSKKIQSISIDDSRPHMYSVPLFFGIQLCFVRVHIRSLYSWLISEKFSILLKNNVQ